MRQVGQFQSEIGLTDDELFIVTFTSLNEDYFNNLLVQAGEFTQWFNLNFAGESQEEIDFRDERVHEWESNLGRAHIIA